MLRSIAFFLCVIALLPVTSLCLAQNAPGKPPADFVFASPAGNYIMLSADGKSLSPQNQRGYSVERADKNGTQFSKLGVFAPVQTYGEFQRLVGDDVAAGFRAYIKAKTDADVVKFFNGTHAGKDYGFYILDINFLRAIGIVYLDPVSGDKALQFQYRLVGPGSVTVRQQSPVAFNQSTLPRGQVRKILTTDSLVSLRWEYAPFTSSMPLLARVYRQDNGEGKFIAVPTRTTINTSTKNPTVVYEEEASPEHLINYYVVAVDILGNEGVPSDTATAITVDFKKVAGVQDIVIRDTLQGLYSTWKPLPAKPYYTGIQILRSRDARNSFIVLDTVAANATSYLDQQVVPNVTYFYKFRPMAYKLSGASEIIATTVHGTRGSSNNPPLAPKNLNASKEGSNIRLTWDPNMELDVFAYYVMRGTSAKNLEIVSPAVMDTTWLDTSATLSGRTNYIYSVLCMNNNQLKSDGSVAAGTSPARGEFIAAPSGITIRPTGKKALLTWQDVARNDAAVAGYILYKKKTADKEFISTGGLITKPYYEDSDIEANTAYVYSVSAVDRFGYESERSPDADFSFKTRITPPAMIFVRKLSTGVEITWPHNPDPAITGYTIYRKSETSAVMVKLGTVRAGELLFLDKKAVPGQLNVYTVTAITAAGESGKSVEKAVYFGK